MGAIKAEGTLATITLSLFESAHRITQRRKRNIVTTAVGPINTEITYTKTDGVESVKIQRASKYITITHKPDGFYINSNADEVYISGLEEALRNV